jgi:hypothetical protein
LPYELHGIFEGARFAGDQTSGEGEGEGEGEAGTGDGVDRD